MRCHPLPVFFVFTLAAAGCSSGGDSAPIVGSVQQALGTWTNTDALNAGRHAHTATLLPSGKVMVVGGASPANFHEVYDPASDTFASGEKW